MIEIALQNLKLLNDETVNIAEKYLISEGNKLSFIAKDNFDPIQNGKLLEYPIYFTYNQVLNEISDNCELSYKQRKYLLNQIDSSLDNLYELINNETDSDDKDNNLDEIIHEIDDRYSIVREKTVITRFEFLFLYFDDFIDALRETSKYLYVTPFQPDQEEEEEEDDEEEEEDDEEEDLDEDLRPDNINIDKLD